MSHATMIRTVLNVYVPWDVANMMRNNAHDWKQECVDAGIPSSRYDPPVSAYIEYLIRCDDKARRDAESEAT